MANDSRPNADNSSSRGSWTPYFIPGFLLYVLLCSSSIPATRCNAQKVQLYKRNISKMTNVDAQAIMSYLGELEFPKIFLASIQFALFKAIKYSITCGTF
ncbi:hypothetical protein V1527DRAFT_475542 [Lipomyces starkeyi]